MARGWRSGEGGFHGAAIAIGRVVFIKAHVGPGNRGAARNVARQCDFVGEPDGKTAKRETGGGGGELAPDAGPALAVEGFSRFQVAFRRGNDVAAEAGGGAGRFSSKCGGQ